MINTDKQDIKYIESDYEWYRTGIENEWLKLKNVPFPLLSPELCELAVSNDGLDLEHVPQEYKSATIYQVAVLQNGMAIKLVPRIYMTLQMAIAAVKQYGEDILKHIPIFFQITEEIQAEILAYKVIH